MHLETSSIVRNANLHELLQTGTQVRPLRLVDPNLKHASRCLAKIIAQSCAGVSPVSSAVAAFKQFVEFCFADNCCGPTQCFNFGSPCPSKKLISALRTPSGVETEGLD
jgi:hypothetical protein